jgi:hypothetical protein
MRTVEAPKWTPHVKRIVGIWECRAAHRSAKAYVDVAALELINVRTPGVSGDGMSERNDSERPELLAGGLGAPAQLRHRI